MLQLESMVEKLKATFYNSVDFIAREISFPKDQYAILCYYSSMANKKDVQDIVNVLKVQTTFNEKDWDATTASQKEAYNLETLVEYVCQGYTVLLLLNSQQMVRFTMPNLPHRSPDEPTNEAILRGAHEGFIEDTDVNLGLIRKRMRVPDLIVKKVTVGTDNKADVYYMYLARFANQENLTDLERRLNNMKDKIDGLYASGQLNDFIEDNPMSPFPQIMNTERPDRVFANLTEGKIVMMADFSPTAYITPVTLFSFYQSPDDFNSRVIVGSFYRMVRVFSFITAIFLPAFYIAIVSFHYEVLPIELSKKLKLDISEIPYRPIFEALIVEIIIELIREASVRLPQALVQTIGIVGGLVVGDVIINAGLVSNMVVIVVALTAISSYVAPSVELNTSVRVLRFPFMFAAALLGFFGILIGALILGVHLCNLGSLKSPYIYPLVPFDPKKTKQILFRGKHTTSGTQPSSFDPRGKKL
ncbi:spore germination protein [Rummeliibacillus stabekisii]|uniref:spore germination protein n=1 Tax=Rummeliibacillus stabekisii TaxID=241244 RepID=UPI001173CF35|nr:spore germination protein [Rummeliibacillus stabekisii]MBB5169030.1 spore germination protein KA [Rummeliibacillus stabekisii]GEL05670.1 germination protein KA [Rummeliibacillus stabekisii]